MGISGDSYRCVDPDDQGDETIVGTSLSDLQEEMREQDAHAQDAIDLARTHSSEVPVFDPASSHAVRIPPPAPTPRLPKRSPESTADPAIPIIAASDPRLAASQEQEEEEDEEGSLSETSEWRVPRRARSADLLGKVVAGRYLLGRVLGEGGMGTVFEAEHADLGRKVAIKVLAPMFDGHGEATARFLREAKAASTIESEHIAQVFDVGEDIHLGLYMVMEILRGDDLAQVLADRGRLRPDLAAGIAWQVCLALERAHEAGVAHRDLKPANVYLTRGDDGSVKVKVLDFGIAKLLRDARTPTTGRGRPITGNGIVVGTPQYMSPEQAQGLETVDQRTDLYSLGALLFECIAGEPPYPELGSYEHTLFKILSEPPPRLAARAAGIPSALGDLVSELMARDPARRPASARAVRERLSAIFPALGKRTVVLGGSAPSVPTPVPPRTGSGVTVDSTIGRSAPPPPRRVHTAVAVGVTGGVLVAMIVAASVHLASRGDAPVSSGIVTSAGSAPVTTETTVTARPDLPASPAPPATGVAALVAEQREAADLVQRAQRALERKDADDARDLAQEATRRAPGSAEAWITLGAAYEALGATEAARAAYQACETQADGDRARECAALLAR